MIKVFPAGPIEAAIRKQAADLNMPLTQYLAPFLREIAEKRLTLVIHCPAPNQQPGTTGVAG